MMTVSQSFGGAFMLAAAQGIFQNELIRILRKSVPQLDPLWISSLGASEDAAKSFPKDQLASILSAFVTALRHTFVLAVPIAGIAFLVSFLQPWFRYHKPEVVGARTTEEGSGGGEKTPERETTTEA
jgi:hypothetical protein